MKKVGLVTFHCAYNYGTALQAFALQQSIDGMGCECKIVDYRSETVTRWDKLPDLKTVRSVGSLLRFLQDGLVLKGSHLQRMRRFEEFWGNQFRLSRRYRSYEDLKASPPQCDAFVCGSDQIWSSFVTGRDKTYLLEFAGPGVKRIAYAPSFASSTLTAEESEVYRGALSQFSALSVREVQGRDLINRMMGREVEVVLDPTFLPARSLWEGLARPQAVPGPYILCYMIGAHPNAREMALAIGRKSGCRIVDICGKVINSIDPRFHVVRNAGPREFLWLFQNATCVLTGSFHGTAFSILNRKPFWTFLHPDDEDRGTGLNTRLTSLLEILNLRERLIRRGSACPDSPFDIDYGRVEGPLEAEISRSLKYLRDALACV